MNKMNDCTEKAKRWPDALAAVSPDELEEFLDHAEVCPFHAEKLRVEEKAFRSVFRSARGLDNDGRILEGVELAKSIAEHERRILHWEEAARKMELPFKHISLSNCGEEIASCGKFLAFPKHLGIHQLETQAGLQIWGILDDRGKAEKVLLGFYPLADVQHAGDEKLLPLDNGYTVGLRVEELGERRFSIEFRCVENAVLEQEQIGIQRETRKKVAAKTFVAGSSFLARLADPARTYFSLLISSMIKPRRAWATAICLFVLASVTAGIVIRHDKPSNGKQIPRVDSNAAASACIIQDRSESVSNTSATKKASVPTVRQSTQNQHLTMRRRRVVESPASTTSPQQSMIAHNKTPVTGKDSSSVAPQSTPSSKPQVATLSNNRSAWYFQSFLKTGGTADKRMTVHSGSDAVLREKLFAELHDRDVSVVPLDGKVCFLLPHFSVSWTITRKDNSVTVSAVLTADGENTLLSFRSNGSCPEQACEKAVRDAISGLFAVMEHSTARSDSVNSDAFCE
jgi:hypothetical protein